MRLANDPKKEIDTSNAELPPALPVVDVWNEIASYLDDKSLANFSASCKFFYKTAKPILDKHKILSQGVACSDTHTLFLTANGEWWGCGANEYGQLGVDDKKNHYELTKFPIEKIKRAYLQWGATLILKQDNTLWKIGRKIGARWDVDDSANQNQAILITTNVKEVFLGFGTVFIFKNDLTCFSFGSNQYGELICNNKNQSLFSVWSNKWREFFNDNNDKCQSMPTKINVDHIKQIFPGVYNTCLLKQDGTLWGVGCNYAGSLGVGDDVSHETLTRITIFDQAGNQEEFVKVFPMEGYSLFLTKNGNLYGCGKLGLDNMPKCNKPTRIPIDEIKNVFNSSLNTFILKKDGSIWGWGNNMCGQLGLGHKKTQSIPIQLTSLPLNVKYIFVGAYHTIFVTKEGDVWGCGSNNTGQLGLDSKIVYQLTPVKLPIGNLLKPQLSSLDKNDNAFMMK